MNLFFKIYSLCKLLFQPYFLLLLLTTFLLLPSVMSGFFLDDYLFFHKLINDGVFPHLLNLFTFSSHGEAKDLIANGALPWWGNPDFKMDFFRPLSSLIFSLDFVLFGKHALAFHLQILFLIFFLLSIWYSIFKMLLSFRITILALIILITSGVFIFPVFFAAEGHIIIAATLTSLGLWFHLLYRHQGWKYGLPLALFSVVGGLLASEAAVGILIYIFCYEWIFSKDRLYKRCLILSPYIILLLIYCTIYKIFQWGANNNYYFNPLETPLSFIKNVAIQFPILFNKLYFGITFANYPFLNLIILLIVSGILLRHLLKLEASNKSVYYWFAASSVLSLLPVLTIVVDPHLVLRMLLPSMIGTAVIIASVMIEAWDRRTQLFSHKQWPNKLLSLFAIYLVIINLIILPFLMLVIPKKANEFNQLILSTATKIKLNKSCKYVVDIAAPDDMTSTFLSGMRTFYHLPTPHNWYVLAENAISGSFTKISSHQFILTTKYNHYSYDKNGELFKNNYLRNGEIFRTNIFQATVISSKNQTPTKILFDFFKSSFDKICWITLSPIKYKTRGSASKNPKIERVFRLQ